MDEDIFLQRLLREAPYDVQRTAGHVAGALAAVSADPTFRGRSKDQQYALIVGMLKIHQLLDYDEDHQRFDDPESRNSAIKAMRRALPRFMKSLGPLAGRLAQALGERRSISEFEAMNELEAFGYALLELRDIAASLTPEPSRKVKGELQSRTRRQWIEAIELRDLLESVGVKTVLNDDHPSLALMSRMTAYTSRRATPQALRKRLEGVRDLRKISSRRKPKSSLFSGPAN